MIAKKPGFDIFKNTTLNPLEHSGRGYDRHYRAKIIYARIIALPYETKNFRRA